MPSETSSGVAVGSKSSIIFPMITATNGAVAPESTADKQPIKAKNFSPGVQYL